MKLAILGSTGSIGMQALEVASRLKNVKVVALSANKNIDLLEKQVKLFKPEFVAVTDEEKADVIKERVNVPVYSGIKSLVKVARAGDVVLNSVVGSVGLLPTLQAVKAGKRVALANKETLVAGGSIVMKEAKRHNALIIPVDSEHSAIHQCLRGEEGSAVKRIILTASGGPFKGKSIEELKRVRLEQALAHPTWRMGAKITVDSATLMNKGFEVIEARWLFDIDYDKIEVVVHPQSIIHSMVEFVDGSIKAQLSMPDMKLPIQYALTYPRRMPLDHKAFSFQKLTFEKPNAKAFPCLSYAYEAGRIGGTMPAVLNAANEVAVSYFLKEKLGFLDIPRIIRKVMNSHRVVKNPSLEDILDVDKRTKSETARLIENELS